jgi:Domain of unknown function (DUF5666)
MTTAPRQAVSPGQQVRPRWRLQACACAVGALLAACGGGDTQTAGVSSGGTGSVGGGKPTLVVGRVTAQSASGRGLVVNGVVVDSDADTVVTDPSDPKAPAALDLDAVLPGTTVVIDGGITTPQADGMHSVAKTIQLHSLLLGTVQSVDVGARTLKVMDHTVALHAQAQIDSQWPQGLASIQAGDTVEVYGWQDVAGLRYIATRLARLPDAPAKPRVTGTLAGLDVSAGQCEVGAQRITFAWPSNTEVRNGQWVVGGLYTFPPDAENRWQALEMTPVNRLPEDRAQISVDGLVNRIQADGTVDVQGWPVQVPTQGCTACSGLALGQHVRVVGAWQGGVVKATELVRQP